MCLFLLCTSTSMNTYHFLHIDVIPVSEAIFIFCHTTEYGAINERKMGQSGYILKSLWSNHAYVWPFLQLLVHLHLFVQLKLVKNHATATHMHLIALWLEWHVNCFDYIHQYLAVHLNHMMEIYSHHNYSLLKASMVVGKN